MRAPLLRHQRRAGLRPGDGALLAALMALLLSGGAVAQDRAGVASEPRVALVIGNSSYAVGPLKNPVNDAEDMAQMLRTLGFRVTLRQNVTQRQMIEAIGELGQQLKAGGGVGLFYFAGHGVQSRGRNFLIPVNAGIDSESQLEFDTVDANRVLAAMDQAGNRVNLVILDACRDNPVARSFRSASRGLAQMEAAQGTYIAFATAPGSVALDGPGRNGLYTHYLLQSLRQPDTDIDKVFRRVTADVARATGGKQVPWISSSLTGDFSFRPDRAIREAVTPAPAAPSPAPAPAARIDSPERFRAAALPFLNDGAKARVEQDFVASTKRHKALAMTEAGGWGMAQGRATVKEARDGALAECQTRNQRHPCFLAALDDDAALPSTYTPQALYDGAVELVRRASLEAEFYFNEERDAGIAPSRARHTGAMHAATPRSVPGAKTITTRELVELYKGSKPVLINVLDWTEGAFALPGTVWIQGMGKAQLSGSEYLELRSLLAQIAPDKTAPLVVYCLSWECWLSYNATLTASDLGYTNLYWYRGGISAWNQARLPVVRTRLLKQF
jgi:PQQ-dependent catabolism-associated CXXCW motif protein